MEEYIGNTVNIINFSFNVVFYILTLRGYNNLDIHNSKIMNIIYNICFGNVVFGNIVYFYNNYNKIKDTLIFDTINTDLNPIDLEESQINNLTNRNNIIEKYKQYIEKYKFIYYTYTFCLYTLIFHLLYYIFMSVKVYYDVTLCTLTADGTNKMNEDKILHDLFHIRYHFNFVTFINIIGTIQLHLLISNIQKKIFNLLLI